MPAGVPVVAFAALANLDCRFNLQTRWFAAPPDRGVYEIWISLMRIVFIRGMVVNRVTKHIRDESAEIITLNIFRKRFCAAC